MTTIVSAVVIGVVVLLAGNLPWAGLGTWNFRAGNTLPWAVPLMAAYLWVYWRVLGGRWSAPAEAEWFRRNLRANRLSPRLWGAALGAGALGFAALLALLAVAARLVILPDRRRSRRRRACRSSPSCCSWPCSRWWPG